MSSGRRTSSSLQPPAPENGGARWRLFVAAPLPDEAAERVIDALAPLRQRHALVRWLPADKLHVTLVFLGSTDSRRVDTIARAVTEVAAGHAPFDVATGGAGGRVGGRRGGVAWLRLSNGAPGVTKLSRDLDDAIGSGAYAPHAAPRPHLTVARGVSDAALADLRAVSGDIRSAWTIDRIALFRSHTDPAGSRYVALCSVMLRGQ